MAARMAAPRRARCMAAVELTHCMSDEAYNSENAGTSIYRPP